MEQRLGVRIIPALAGNTRVMADNLDDMRDHPRSRGEYLASVLVRASSQGIIPALAGNTQQRAMMGANTADHPRSRGEYGGCTSRMAAWGGSSPLSRGIQSEPAERWAAAGIIPALAGNTRPAGHSGFTATDHPRSRGEYEELNDLWIRVEGSSPLSRGIRQPRACTGRRRRIIPALAGNTLGAASCAAATEDHPRSRGEYQQRRHRHHHGPGSSPLSRGIRGIGKTYGAKKRIIPALAGNTVTARWSPAESMDHPRSRGEY